VILLRNARSERTPEANATAIEALSKVVSAQSAAIIQLAEEMERLVRPSDGSVAGGGECVNESPGGQDREVGAALDSTQLPDREG
jgi:hypothetical protein